MLHFFSNRGPWKNGSDFQCIFQCIQSGPVHLCSTPQMLMCMYCVFGCTGAQYGTIVCMHESICEVSKKQVRMRGTYHLCGCCFVEVP